MNNISLATNHLGDFVKNKRLELNLSLRDFARMCNLSHSHVDSIEKGYEPKTKKPVKPSIDTLVKISKGADIEIGTLIDLAIKDSADDMSYSPIYPTPIHSERSLEKQLSTRVIPLYGNTSPHPPTYEIASHINGIWGVVVSDDSMKNVGIFPGDIVITAYTDTFETGQIVIYVKSNKILVRFYIKKNDDIYLRAANLEYPDIKVSNIQDIFGKVTTVIRENIPTYQDIVKETD